MRRVTDSAPSLPTSGWAVGAALALVASGAALRWSCLGADGLTQGEAAMAWCYSDVVGIFQGRGLAADPSPYREVLTEYPPLTGLQWWAAGAASRTASGFFLLTAAAQTVAAAVTVVLLHRAGVGRGRLLLIALAPSLLLSGTLNWDLVAVALLTAGLVVAGVRATPVGASTAGGPAAAGADVGGPAPVGPVRPLASGALLGLGGLAKVFPLAAVPVLAWWAVTAGHRRWALHHGLAAVGTVAAIQVPVALWAPSGWDAWIPLQRERPVDWDTVWYGIQRLTGHPLPAGVVEVLVLLAGAAGVAVILWHGRARTEERWRLLLPVLIWILLAGKVHSPQFSLWLLPLLALSRVPLPLVGAWLLADAAVVLTRFPFLAAEHGFGMGSGVPTLPYPAFAAALVLRGVLLLLILAAVIRPRHPARP